MNGATEKDVSLAVSLTSVDPDALTARARTTWESRDRGPTGGALRLVGQSLCKAVGLSAGSNVLAVVADCDAAVPTTCDWSEIMTSACVASGLEVEGSRAAAEVSIQFADAAAEALPFPSETFDVVLSVFGVMFAADHVRTAHELMRVCRSAGRVGLANWTPGGFMGRLLAVLDNHAASPHARTPPTWWGEEGHLEYLFRGSAFDLQTTSRHFVYRFRSAEPFVDTLRRRHKYVRAAFASLSPKAQRGLAQDLLDLIDDFSVSRTGTTVVPSEYLEVVIVKK